MTKTSFSIILAFICLIPITTLTLTSTYTETQPLYFIPHKGLYITTPSSYDMLVNCSIVELKAADKTFLKERCYYNGEEFYKCPFTDEYYNVDFFYSPWSNKEYYVSFSRACEDDPHFYQMCGHGGLYHSYSKVKGHEFFCSTYVCHR